MTTAVACVTVIDGDDQRDLAVPAGTTVAGLAAMLRLDPSNEDHHLTLADGRPADLHAVLGSTLPSGQLLAIGGRHPEAHREVGTPPSDLGNATTPALAAALCLGVPLMWATLLVLLPRYGWWHLGARWQGAGGAAALGGSVMLLLAPPVRRRPAWAAAATAVAAMGTVALTRVSAGLMPSTAASAALTGVTVPVSAGAVAGLCLGWWALGRSQVAATLAISWILVGAVGLAVAGAGIRLALLSPVGLGLGAAALAVVPALSVQVDDNELLDMPLVSTSPQRLRSPSIPSPSRITGTWVARALHEVRERNDVLVLGLCSVIATCVPATVGRLEILTWPGRSTLALLVCAALVLATAPRHQSSRLARWVPRACALEIVVATIVGQWVRDRLGGAGVIALLLTAALVIVALSAAVCREEPSALPGRLADLAESTALAVLVPATVISVGAFDLARGAGW